MLTAVEWEQGSSMLCSRQKGNCTSQADSGFRVCVYACNLQGAAMRITHLVLPKTHWVAAHIWLQCTATVGLYMIELLQAVSSPRR